MPKLTQKYINDLNNNLNSELEKEYGSKNLPFYDFNINLQKELKKHMDKHSPCKAYVLDIENDQAIEIETPDKSKPSFKCKDGSPMPDMYNEVNYYWLEYKKGNDEYRITMFMKELDRSTGNIHVIPGVAEKWKKRKANSRAPKTNIIEFDDEGKLRLTLKGNIMDSCYLISEVIGEEYWDPNYKKKEDWRTQNWNSKIKKDVIYKNGKDKFFAYSKDKLTKAKEKLIKEKLIKECHCDNNKPGIAPRLDWFRWLNLEFYTNHPWFVSMFKIVYTNTCGLVILFNDMFVGEGECGPTDVTYSFNYEILKKK